MDADMVCHSPVSMEKLSQFFPTSADLCFAGRSKKFTECGLYGMHVTEPAVQSWLAEFQHMYDDAEQGIFTLDEWHDSFVFDAVRTRHTLREQNWTANLQMGEGHPLINCEWGAYIDHLKGTPVLILDQIAQQFVIGFGIVLIGRIADSGTEGHQVLNVANVITTIDVSGLCIAD
jgi:hypothetical protein